MMAWKLTEQVVTDVIAYLTANFAAKAAALNTDYGDGVTISAPVAYHKGERPNIPKYPACFVMARASKVTPSNMTLSGTGMVSGVHDVVLRIYDRGTNTDTVSMMMYRYARALLELLLEGEGASSHSGFVLAADGDVAFDFFDNLNESGRIVSSVQASTSFEKMEQKT